MNKTLLKQIIDIYKDSERAYICGALRDSNCENQNTLTDFIHNILFLYSKEYLELFPHYNIKLGQSILLFSEVTTCSDWIEINREVRINFLNWLYESNI